MSENIVETLNRFPKRIKELAEEAIFLSVAILQLEDIDSSAYMLAITRLGESNASAKWLRSIGITEEAIVSAMIAHSNERGHDELMAIASAQSGTDTFVGELRFTTATEKMFEILTTSFCRPAHGSVASLFVKDVLAAVVLSGSDMVEQLFLSVGYTMSMVHTELRI
jgi:hypothetical protein